MKVTVQVVIEAENGTSTIVQEVGQLERASMSSWPRLTSTNSMESS